MTKCQASLKNVHLFILLTVIIVKQLNIGFLVNTKRPLGRFWLGSRGGDASGDASGEDEMTMVSVSSATALWDCMYILGHVMEGGIFSPVGGIVAGEAEDEV